MGGQGQGPPRFWQITPQIFKPSDIPAEMFGLSATPNGFEGYVFLYKEVFPQHFTSSERKLFRNLKHKFDSQICI